MQVSPFSVTGSGLERTEFAKLPDVIPETMQFQPTRRGMPAMRVPVKIRSEQQAYSSNANKMVRFMLPNNALYDTRYGYLSFTLTLTVTGGTYCRVHSGIFSIFQRLRIIAASTEIEDLRDYNRLQAILWETINPIDVTGNIGVVAMGFGTQAQRNALFPTSDFVCPLFSGVLNTELLPFDNFNAPVVLELYLDDAVNCVETDGANPIVTISNPVFHIERLEVDPAYRARLSTMVSSQGLQIGFRTWTRFINALNTGTTQQLTINARNSSIYGLLSILVNSSQISDPTVNDRFLTWLPTPTGGAGTLTQSQLQINGRVFPDEPVDLLNLQRFEPYQNYLRWIMKWKTNGLLEIAPPISIQAFQTTRFIQIDDLEAYPEHPELVNPASTLTMNNALLKKFTFSTTIGPNYQLDTWVESYQQIMITREGSVVVLQ